MKDPLVAPLAAIASGILAAHYVPFHAAELFAAIAAFFVLGVVAVWRGSRALAGSCACLGLFFTGALTSVAKAPVVPPELDVQGREMVLLAGCVVEPPAVSGERERFLLELEPAARIQVTIFARDGEGLPALRYGQNIELDARVRRPHNFGNPGAFDFEHYLARQHIYWTASSAAGTVRVLPGRCGSRFQKIVMDWRATSLARIESLFRGSDYQVGMMQALLIGQSYQLQKVWTEDYRSTGTFHALVISGSHVAVLAAFFLLLLRLCFLPQSMALLLTVVAAWAYALVTGWQAPCIRSAAGLTLFMIGSHFYREKRPLNLLAAVALIFLVLDPEQLFEASFQLTFLAVAFLAVFAAPLVEATSGPLGRALGSLADTGRDLHLPPRAAQFRIELRLLVQTLSRLRIPRPVAALAVPVTVRVVLFIYEVTVISAVVQIGLALPMIVYFHRIGVTGLSANTFIVPLMSILVPLGFVTVVTGSHFLSVAAAALLTLTQKIVSWHAAIEPNWRIPNPPLWLALALAGALIAAALARGRGWRIGTFAMVIACLGLVLWSPFPAQVQGGQLELTAIDVGQGDSLFIAFPDGRRMLLDGGGIPNFGRHARAQLDIGEDVVAPYLWGRAVRGVDVIALSHAHEDHIGGLAALIADFQPRELWTGATPSSPAWDRVRVQAARLGVTVVPLRSPASFQFGGAGIDVLAPLSDYLPGATPKNNDSLVLRLRYGRHTFLLSGDIERQVEARLVEEGGLQSVDVLKVAHHGSRTSTTQSFLEVLHPAYAVVSAGLDNSYGHPNADVIARLRALGTDVLRTDRDGLVTIRTDGRRLTAETYRDVLLRR